LAKAQDWQGLRDHNRRWTQAEPGNYFAWSSLGFAYNKMKSYREAIEAYREALRLKPDLAQAWNNLAIAYGVLGNRSAALEAVQQLRRYDPQQAEKLFNHIMKR
jgi:tetratricopeptide (TPR) repeat protein